MIFHKSYSEKIFKVELDVYVGDREEVSKMIFDKYQYKIREDCLGEHVEMVNEKQHELRNIVWVSDYSNFYTLSHELIHLVKCIFGRDSIPFNGENEEAIAYYHTYWFKRIWHDLNLFKNKNKK